MFTFLITKALVHHTLYFLCLSTTHRLNITHSVTTGETTQAVRLLGRFIWESIMVRGMQIPTPPLFLSSSTKTSGENRSSNSGRAASFRKIFTHALRAPLRGLPEQYVRCALFSFVVYGRRQQTVYTLLITNQNLKLSKVMCHNEKVI